MFFLQASNFVWQFLDDGAHGAAVPVSQPVAPDAHSSLDNQHAGASIDVHAAGDAIVAAAAPVAAAASSAVSALASAVSDAKVERKIAEVKSSAAGTGSSKKFDCKVVEPTKKGEGMSQ